MPNSTISRMFTYLHNFKIFINYHQLSSLSPVFINFRQFSLISVTHGNIWNNSCALAVTHRYLSYFQITGWLGAVYFGRSQLAPKPLDRAAELCDAVPKGACSDKFSSKSVQKTTKLPQNYKIFMNVAKISKILQ